MTAKLTITWSVENEQTGEEYPGPPLTTEIDVDTLLEAFEDEDDELTDPVLEEHILTEIRVDFVEKITPVVDVAHLAAIVEEARKLILAARAKDTP